MSTPQTARGRTTGPALRDQLSSLHAILALNQRMTDSDDEHEILRLAATALPAVSPCRLIGAYLAGRGWQLTSNELVDSEVLVDIQSQLVVVGDAGGAIAAHHQAWGWAFPLRSVGGAQGFVAVAADAEPPEEQQFLLRVLAQQAGVAIARARALRQQRDQATELRAANAKLADTVAVLERSRTIYDRLSRVAVAGEGQDGIARAMHELTGLPVTIEDRHGNMRSWAGPDQYTERPTELRSDREALLRRGLHAGGVIRHKDRILVVAQSTAGVVAVLALVDSEERAGDDARIALERGAVVLAIELARISAIAETELRLRRDLVDELLTGTDDDSVVARAEALGYDLKRPHRVIVVESIADSSDLKPLLHAVRRAALDCSVGGLIASRCQSIIVLTDNDRSWEVFGSAIEHELKNRKCFVGVGGTYETVADLPRSYREALLALRVRRLTDSQIRVSAFDQLGVYRILAGIEDLGEIERFARSWLGGLIEYDAHRGTADLVHTLGRYFDCGGNYDATAHSLLVSRSTLKYRLQRVREISRHDLTDPETQFNLQFALRAWRTLISLRPPESAPRSSGRPRRLAGRSLAHAPIGSL